MIFTPWKLADLVPPAPHAPTVFSCFACGGGSSMGYKLAGFNVIGINEIDPHMVETYTRNMSPQHVFQEPIQSFKDRGTFPDELLNLDILDGSPPCSTFSMAGSRERAWGKQKKFREGQADQVLDTLFFDFIALAERLKPKIVIAENVKGMLQGNARGYCRAIFQAFNEIGYDCQLFLVDATSCGVPQKRERVFFVARKRDLNLSPLTFSPSCALISFSNATSDLLEDAKENLSPGPLKYWKLAKTGQVFHEVHARGSYFNWNKIDPNRPVRTITATACMTHWKFPRKLNRMEVVRCSSFPDDYDFGSERDSNATYVCGMSVPPFMIRELANAIKIQWLGCA